jgi:FtsH-binding integral membrane protein
LRVTLRDLLIPAVIKIALALAITAGGWYLLAHAWPSDMSDSLWETFGRLLVMALVGIGIYAVVAFLLRLPEPRMVVERIVARFTRS